MTTTIRARPTIAFLSLFLVVAPSSTSAEVLRCQRAIARAGAQLFQVVAKATDKCESTVVHDGAGTCPDAKMTAAIAKASAKLRSIVDRGCGGSDGTCNGDGVDEDLPAAIGWPDACPALATEDCQQTLATCAGVASCLECLGTAAAHRTSALVYDDLALPSTGNATVNACQRTLGKANAAYAGVVSRALEKCWQSRMTGGHADACIPPALADGKYLGAIAKAEAKRASVIGRACGGGDRVIGGSDDLTPAAIGFADTCPTVAAPGGPPCGGAISDLAALVGCLDCVTDAAVTCVDRAQVPQLAAYPAECAQCLSPPPSGPCPTTLALTVAGDRVDLDVGFTGLAHDVPLPSNSGVTVATTCAGTNHPTCGECTIAGPIADGGGPSAASRRCRDHTWQSCVSDGDCGGGDPCVTFFGPPEGVVVDGISACVLNEITGPVTGTLNLTDGTAAMQLGFRRITFIAGFVGQGCPACVTGTCDSGLREGEACTVQGGGSRGDDVTLDCPPHPGGFFAASTMPFTLSTGEQTREVTPDSPTCRQTGYTSLKCLCDSCNNVNFEACASNADCPDSGGGPGICGGRRCVGGSEDGKPCSQCIGGANHGATCSNATACPGGACPLGCAGACAGGSNHGASCTTASACPGGTCPLGQCNRLGEATQPSSCADDPALPGSQATCVATSDGEGRCLVGPIDQVCSVDTFVRCDDDDGCRPSAGCTACSTEEQTCIMRSRECFTDNGVAGSPVVAVGKPGPPCADRAQPTLAAFACVQPVKEFAGNAAIGLPALGRIRLPFDFTP